MRLATFAAAINEMDTPDELFIGPGTSQSTTRGITRVRFGEFGDDTAFIDSSGNMVDANGNIIQPYNTAGAPPPLATVPYSSNMGVSNPPMIPNSQVPTGSPQPNQQGAIAGATQGLISGVLNFFRPGGGVYPPGYIPPQSGISGGTLLLLGLLGIGGYFLFVHKAPEAAKV